MPVTSHRFYAMYLQSVDRSDGQRWQWLVCPPVKIPGRPMLSDKITWWERTQFISSQRPQWYRHYEGDHTNTNRDFWGRVRGYVTSRTWITCEPVIVKVQEADVIEWVGDGSTPYPLIRALERQTKKRGIQISGPTSVPQVVTEPPSS